MGFKAFLCGICKSDKNKDKYSEVVPLAISTKAANDAVFEKWILSKEYLLILTEFNESECWKKYGKNVQQSLILDWLQTRCDHEGRRRILKELINQAYEINTGRVKDSMLTIC